MNGNCPNGGYPNGPTWGEKLVGPVLAGFTNGGLMYMAYSNKEGPNPKLFGVNTFIASGFVTGGTSLLIQNTTDYGLNNWENVMNDKNQNKLKLILEPAIVGGMNYMVARGSGVPGASAIGTFAIGATSDTVGNFIGKKVYSGTKAY